MNKKSRSFPHSHQAAIITPFQRRLAQRTLTHTLSHPAIIPNTGPSFPPTAQEEHTPDFVLPNFLYIP